MRSLVALSCRAAAVVVIGFGAITAVVPTVAYGEPSPGDSDPGSGETDSEDYGGGGGGSDYQPNVPTFNKPTSTISAQTVERRAPRTPEYVPPEVIPPTFDEPVPVNIPRVPVDIPLVPVDVPVIVAPPVPVAVPVTPPVELPKVPAPPAAPPLPVPAAPQVLLTSSAQPGTQALTIIMVFLVAGAWIYAHRIASHWTSGRKPSAQTTT